MKGVIMPCSKLTINTRNRLQARENGSDQVAIGFNFASDWSRGSGARFLHQSQTGTKAKPKQTNAFDTHENCSKSKRKVILLRASKFRKRSRGSPTFS